MRGDFNLLNYISMLFLFTNISMTYIIKKALTILKISPLKEERAELSTPRHRDVHVSLIPRQWFVSSVMSNCHCAE